MTKKQIQEFDTEARAMSGEDFDADKTELKEGQKDFSGMILGNYKFLYPVLVDKYTSFTPLYGWMCQNIETKKYRIIINLAVNKMYMNYCADSSYLGLDYIECDSPYKKLDANHFREEFIEETKKIKDYGYDFFIEHRNKLLHDSEKYVDNVVQNLAYFRQLDKNSFNLEVDRIAEKYHFKPIDNISSFKNCLYMAVLDEYNQFYIGKCVGSLKNRMRKHWTAKVIPNRQLGDGHFEYSKIKYDNFKMYDTTRMFVCEDIDKVLDENQNEANDPKIEHDNTFGITLFECMTPLDKAERIVINNCKCLFVLSDRPPLLNFEEYDKLSKRYGVEKNDLLIKHYIELDKYVLPKRSEFDISKIAKFREKNK